MASIDEGDDQGSDFVDFIDSNQGKAMHNHSTQGTDPEVFYGGIYFYKGTSGQGSFKAYFWYRYL